MKYRLEGLIIEAIDNYVRVSVGGYVGVTQKQCPTATEVSSMLKEMQGYWPNRAQMQACGRAADDAYRNNECDNLSA